MTVHAIIFHHMDHFDFTIPTSNSQIWQRDTFKGTARHTSVTDKSDSTCQIGVVACYQQDGRTCNKFNGHHNIMV